MKKYIFFILMIVSATCWSQNSRLSGKVIDATTGNVLSGAKISENGKTVAFSTEIGRFSLKCSPNMELVVSFMGYQSSSITISDCSEEILVALVPASNELQEVRISSTNTSEKNMLEKPVSEVKLSPAELNRGTGIFLDDAINANVPGVTMNRRAVSSGQQFNIRGYGNGVGFKGATNNFDGQGYKVYLNNIPITDAEGVTLMDDIDFGSIGQVDVIKGPAGTKYGLAIAGVVQLESIKPKSGETALKQSVLTGSSGLARYTTQFSTASENTSLLLNYAHQTSDGYMAHTASAKDYVNAIFDARLSAKQMISVFFGYANSYDERGGELTIEQYAAKDYSGSGRYIKNNAHSEIVSFRAGANYKYLINDWLSNNTSVFGSGVSNNSSSGGGWTDKSPVNYGLRSTFDFALDLNGDFGLTGSTGIELQEQRAQIQGFRMVENPEDPEGYNIIGAPKSDQFARSANASVFTEWTLQMPHNFSLIAGLGYSEMHVDLEDRLYEPENDNERNVSADYDQMYSPHLAINKIFSDDISVYASYSKAYNAPVSGNIVLSTSGELNTGLRPEVGNQFEVGSKGLLAGNRLQYQVAVFNAIFKDKFTSVAVPLDENTTAYTYIANGGKMNNKGVEVLLKYSFLFGDDNFFSVIRPFANVTYSHFRYEDFSYESLDSNGQAIVADYTGNAVAGVSPWVANAGVDLYSRSGFYGNINYSFKDAMPFTSDGEHVTDAYHLLNSKLGYKNNFGNFEVDVFGGVQNITGTQYYYMVFLNQLPDAYLPAPYEASFFGGINLAYKL